MVYVFKNGKVIYSCATISGRPVPGRKTTTGMFFIKEHARHRILHGDPTINTPVRAGFVSHGREQVSIRQNGSHGEAGAQAFTK